MTDFTAKISNSNWPTVEHLGGEATSVYTFTAVSIKQTAERAQVKDYFITLQFVQFLPWKNNM